jgi:peptidoglycan hydrolase-like protein with peptidoglycan-binding domain
MKFRHADIARQIQLSLFAFLIVAMAGAFSAHSSNVNAVQSPFLKNYQLYDTNDDIRSLQEFLNSQGYIVAQNGPGSPGNDTSIFGLHTYQALKHFQLGRGLPPTGFFGPLTRAAINSAGSVSLSSPSTSFSSNATSTPLQDPNVLPFPHLNVPGKGYTPGFGGGGGGGGPDTIPPVISGTPSNFTAEASSGSGASVSYTNPTATDNVDGAVGVSCSPASGSSFALGTTAVTCSATDRAGNS